MYATQKGPIVYFSSTKSFPFLVEESKIIFVPEIPNYKPGDYAYIDYDRKEIVVIQNEDHFTNSENGGEFINILQLEINQI